MIDGGLGVGVLIEPIVVSLAEKYHKTAAQIVLRWNIQRGVVVIPKSTHHQRNMENYAIFDFELTAEEVNLSPTFLLSLIHPLSSWQLKWISIFFFFLPVDVVNFCS